MNVSSSGNSLSLFGPRTDPLLRMRNPTRLMFLYFRHARQWIGSPGQNRHYRRFEIGIRSVCVQFRHSGVRRWCKRMRLLMNVLSLLVILSLNTPSVEKGVVTFRPGPRESSVPARFRLERADYSYELEPVLETPRYHVARLRFASPVRTPDRENNMVHGEYFAPVGFGPKRPGVIVLHILGAGFSAFPLHGGPACRPGSGSPFCQASLLWRASARW